MKQLNYTLGISAFYHDSACALLQNGKIIAAAQEERFSRKKHDPRFPFKAINYCLEEAFITPEDIQLIVFYDNPLLTYDRVLKNALTIGKDGEEVFNQATKSILGSKLWVEKYVKKAIGCLGKEGRVLFAGHHLSHAASAFFATTFNDAAIITLDGVGEWSTTTISHGSDNKIELLKEINYPHSLGLLYSAFTSYCGFKVNSGEYKLMGLAPYGVPHYIDKIYKHLVDVKDDGSFQLNMEYFSWMSDFKTTNEKFHQLFGGPPRKPESKISKREMDIAASIQVVTEEIVIKIARYTREITKSNNLCMAGGVALNCMVNGKLLREKIYDNFWIQPAAGDAGGALGAAYLGHYLYGKNPRLKPTNLSHRDSNKEEKTNTDWQQGSYLGPQYSTDEVKAFLERNDLPFERIENDLIRNNMLAKELCEGRVIGFFSGRMEFGPRALGARSILGDARNGKMQSRMNLKIKYRESFRPFAPIVLEEDAHLYFDLDEPSPYMLLIAPIKKERRLVKENPQVDGFGLDMIEIVNQKRSDVPAITHVDFSARVQTVNSKVNPQMHMLLRSFKEQTGYGLLVNTSFNVRGEPIVCSPRDAYRCFVRTGMDTLVIDDFVLIKELQPKFEESDEWKKEYELD